MKKAKKEPAKEYTMVDIGKMSDDQLVQLHRENLSNIIDAGMACGELQRRGYDLVENDGEPDQFVKKEQKVA